jgi:hypothetical protein
VPDLVPRWPLLEQLELEAKPSPPSVFHALAASLAQHCPNFVSLKTSGVVKPEDAELLAVLAGCHRELRDFSARSCIGFDENDEEVTPRVNGMRS